MTEINIDTSQSQVEPIPVHEHFQDMAEHSRQEGNSDHAELFDRIATKAETEMRNRAATELGKTTLKKMGSEASS